VVLCHCLLGWLVILKKLPDYRKKQSILYIAATSDKDLIAYGDGYLKTGRIADAVEFYQKANHIAGLIKIRKLAEEAGDIMLFQSAIKALKEAVTNEDWNNIGQKALEQKNFTFAIHAFKKSNHNEKLEEIKSMLKAKD
jgi:tetratricopeptide (TPR) repeat protein